MYKVMGWSGSPGARLGPEGGSANFATRRWEPTRRWCARISMPPVPGVARRRIWPPSPPWRPTTPPRRLQGAASNDKACAADGDREALGRSRGGLSTKIHLAADDRCRPIARIITAGQRHDAVAFPPLMRAIRIRRRNPGRPRTRPATVRADKAYSSRDIRAYLRRRRIRATVPERSDPQAHRTRRGSSGGRPPRFDSADYKQRNTVARAISKLKQFRAVATRYDKRAYSFAGTVDVASIRIWLRDPVP